MKSIIKLYTSKWYAPILIGVLLGLISFYTISIQNEIVFILSFYLPLISLLFSIFLGIYRIIRKQYLQGVFQVVLSVLAGCVIYFFVSIYVLYYPFDYYASSLTIPDTITVYEPNENESKGFSCGNSADETDFQLYNSFQPGLYEYDCVYKAPSKGYLYLRAFEVTKNDPLSVSRLRDRSRINIETIENQPIKYCSKEDFTIYEGDWGDKYAARFEVWFSPSDGSEEVKVIEKVYSIEGWQR